MSFLNTDYEDGGLGLNPAHFSGLVAIMCVCQLFYQFYAFPRLGPPGGPLSHIAMVSRSSPLAPRSFSCSSSSVSKRLTQTFLCCPSSVWDCCCSSPPT